MLFKGLRDRQGDGPLVRAKMITPSLLFGLKNTGSGFEFLGSIGRLDGALTEWFAPIRPPFLRDG